MIDWQTIVVVLIIFAACGYVARRGFIKLRTVQDSACETGCGKCVTTSKTNKESLIQISRLK